MGAASGGDHSGGGVTVQLQVRYGGYGGVFAFRGVCGFRLGCADAHGGLVFKVCAHTTRSVIFAEFTRLRSRRKIS